MIILFNKKFSSIKNLVQYIINPKNKYYHNNI